MSNNQRLLAIGDIHGCLDELTSLIQMVSPEPSDTLVFLGDYVNRGPDSKGVVEYLLDLQKEFQAVFLLGNHDKMFLDYIDRQAPSFMLNGGAETLNSYSPDSPFQIPDSHLSFFRKLQPLHETDDFIFVHAGLRPQVSLQDQKINDLLWIRDEFLNSDYDWGKTIVYGHTISPKPVISPKRIGIDTGCSFSFEQLKGQLTCMNVMNLDVWTV